MSTSAADLEDSTTNTEIGRIASKYTSLIVIAE